MHVILTIGDPETVLNIYKKKRFCTTKQVLISFFLVLIVAFSAHANSDNLLLMGDDFPPFAFKKNGEVTGLSVEILRTILKELNIPDTIEIYPWDRAYKTALKKKNAIVFTTARTKEREHLFKWVGPIAPRAISLYKLKRRTDIQITTFEEAKQYIVGTIKGYAAEKTLLNNGFVIGKNIDQATENIQNIKKIYANRIDLIAAFDSLIAHAAKQINHSFKDFEKVLVIDDAYEFYYAINRQTDTILVSNFQMILDKMKTDGRYQRLLTKFAVAP